MRGRGKWVRTVLVGIAVALTHFVLAFLAMVSVLAAALGSISLLGRVLMPLFTVLWFPAILIIGRWTEGLIGFSNQATLGLLMGTSLLWGTTLALLWRWWRLRVAEGKRKVQRASLRT